MNNIFITNTSTDVQLRADATIRIRYYKHGAASSCVDVLRENDFREVQLLEFHPDNYTCCKCRSTAYVQPEMWMTHEPYKRAGEGYLKSSEQYVLIREFMILEEDRQALLAYCAKYRDHGPLIIHPCPRPFPMFVKGERVKVVGPDMWEKEDKVGALATVAENSSEGTLTQVTFDQEEYNKGTDGRISPSIGIPSLSLRLATDVVCNGNNLVIAPLLRFYEAAKASLTELEQISADATDVDWDYIGRKKVKMRQEISEFECRFHNYKSNL